MNEIKKQVEELLNVFIDKGIFNEDSGYELCQDMNYLLMDNGYNEFSEVGYTYKIYQSITSDECICMLLEDKDRAPINVIIKSVSK